MPTFIAFERWSADGDLFVILKFAWREIRRNWKINLFFIMNLSLGLVGFLMVDSFKTTIQQYLAENAKKILSADLSVSVRREITENEIQSVRKVLGDKIQQESQIYDFFAMLSSTHGSKLVLVKAVDSTYPFYGELELASGLVAKSDTPSKALFSAAKAWAYPELKHQLDLQTGDQVKLGDFDFILDDFVVKDSTQTFRLTSLAPRIFIDRKFLKQTGLIKFGSTFTHSYLFKLKNNLGIDADITQIYSLIKDPAFVVDTPKTASEASSRQLDYLSDFLSLVSLVAIVLSALGAAYLYRLYLSQHIKEIAIYRSLGLAQSAVLKIYISQITILGVLSLIPTAIGVSLLLPLLTHIIEQLTSLKLYPTISAGSLLVTYAIAFSSSFLVTLPYLLKLNQLKPAKLFSEEKFSTDLNIQKPYIFIPALVFLYLL